LGGYSAASWGELLELGTVQLPERKLLREDLAPAERRRNQVEEFSCSPSPSMTGPANGQGLLDLRKIFETILKFNFFGKKKSGFEYVPT